MSERLGQLQALKERWQNQSERYKQVLAESGGRDLWAAGAAETYDRCIAQLDGRILGTSPATFQRGDLVKKRGTKGQWHGRICGEYSTDITPEGYAVESLLERGSVQIYPASALEPWDGEGE